VSATAQGSAAAELGSVVADVMIRFPKTCGPGTTVADARSLLADDHVHALLVVTGDVLLAVVVRDDLPAADSDRPVVELGRLADRVVGPDADLPAAHRRMARDRIRRLAVVDGTGRLLGLLCRKRSDRGFCSDDDVGARAAERGGRV
jgi:CBS domain-containing protein